ncbi:hypothetical protein [Streptomyces roseoviridis]|uniref:DUF3060 domain-containing protein n=1 Tax=Streptomyces roseoviridis TaxID=67361 RepID=A0ABV5QZ62_9ACTN
MIRHSMRALCAAALVIAPIALTATPAHAVTCTVNGATVTADVVMGTPGNDVIRCGTVPDGHQVNGVAGNDSISVTGDVAGLVTGGPGSDHITVSGSLDTGTVSGNDASDYIAVQGTVGPGSAVTGGLGNDILRVNVNNGTVDGAGGFDSCRVTTGAPPVNCEY